MPFRRNKRRQEGLVATTPSNEEYYVGEGRAHHGGSGRVEIGKIQARGEVEVGETPITDLASMEDACEGLPTNGKEILL